jgi:DNA polymerase III alpha subunit (gram-positive type)
MCKIAHFDLECSTFGPEEIPYDLPQDKFDEWLASHGDKAVIEFAGKIVQSGKVIEELHILINPGKVIIAPQAIEVHGITPDMVENAMPFSEAGELIKDFFSKCDFACAYNGRRFDKQYLELEFSRLRGKIVKFNLPIFDPFIFYKSVDSKRAVKKGASLLAGATSYGCGKSSDIKNKLSVAHRAMNDIDMQIDLVNAMMIKDIQCHTVQELFELQDKLEQKQNNIREKNAKIRANRKAKVEKEIEEAGDDNANI